MTAMSERTVEQMCRDLLDAAIQDEVVVSHSDPQQLFACDMMGMANELSKILDDHIVRHAGIQLDLTQLRKDAERWRKFALCQHLNEQSVEAAKNIIGDCPMEVLEMVSVLMDLDISTHDFANGLAAAGFISRTEEATARADNYRESMNSLVSVWGEPEDDGSDDDAVDALT